jgi:hypothetical protein
MFKILSLRTLLSFSIFSVGHSAQRERRRKLLPPTAEYLDLYSKGTEAAALLAGLSWIQSLLDKYPNHTDSAPSPLPIPVDNEGVAEYPNHTNSAPPPLPIPVDNEDVVKDVHRTINDQTWH